MTPNRKPKHNSTNNDADHKPIIETHNPSAPPYQAANLLAATEQDPRVGRRQGTHGHVGDCTLLANHTRERG